MRTTGRTGPWTVGICIGLMSLLPAAARAMHAPAGPDLDPCSNALPAGISVRASLGSLNGRATRSASIPTPGGDRRRISRATWDLSGLFLVGAEATAELSDVIRVNAGLWRTVNNGGGQMEEYRWLWTDHDWSHWQKGDVDAGGRMFDLNVGLDLATVRGLVLCGVAGWKRSAWEWKDRGLWYRESEKGFRDKAGSYGGINTAEYEQTFSTLYAGGDARVSPAAGLDLEGYLLLSPLSWSSDSAHYRLRETKTFPDGVHVESGSVFGLYLGAGGRATLHLTEELYAGLSVDLETFPKRTGDQKTLETNEVVEDGTAVSAAATMFSAVLGWRF